MTKILVIDDENSLRENIIETLTFEGYEVLGAADGVEGVNAAMLFHPDLIICDISMPRLDGYGVLVDIQANSITRSTPFIFLTARADPREIRKGMQIGADDYLTKPFTPDDLLGAIQARLEKKAQQDQEAQQQVGLFTEMLTHERTQRILQSRLISMLFQDFQDSLITIGFANSLVRAFIQEGDSARSFQEIDRVEAITSQLTAMLEGMKLFMQMEIGRFTVKPVSINLGQFVAAIIDEFRTLYGTTHQFSFERRFDGVVLADVRLLRQIVTNLITNAVKYSPARTTVRISLIDLENRFSFVVRDQSIDIPDFTREGLLNTMKNLSELDTGLDIRFGLIIVKYAVELYGGTIEVESQADRGSSIIVRLPAHLNG